MIKAAAKTETRKPLLKTVRNVIAGSHDAVAEWREKAGDISGVDVFLNMVLVVTFIRPEQTKGGIFMPEKALKEDEYQGKVGLVLKCGPLAFRDDRTQEFGGLKAEPGDWAVYHALDGWQLKLNGVHCRLLQDVHIKGRVADPTIVY